MKKNRTFFPINSFHLDDGRWWITSNPQTLPNLYIVQLVKTKWKNVRINNEYIFIPPVVDGCEGRQGLETNSLMIALETGLKKSRVESSIGTNDKNLQTASMIDRPLCFLNTSKASTNTWWISSLRNWFHSESVYTSSREDGTSKSAENYQ